MAILILIFLIIIISLFAFFCFLLKKEKVINKGYKDLIYDILNVDLKTRKIIEKNCNDYLEHKVVNDFASKEYLNNVKLILDRIKYLNMINSIETIEKEKTTETTEKEKTTETTEKTETKKGGKSK